MLDHIEGDSQGCRHHFADILLIALLLNHVLVHADAWLHQH